MRKQLEDFLIELSDFYPIPSSKNYDKVISLSLEYLLQYCAGKEIDFKKARHWIFDNYKFKGFPELALIKESILASEVIKINSYGDGGLAVITYPTGVIYAFDICGMGKSLNEIKKEVMENYGNVQVKTYPKGSVLIGREVLMGG